LRHYLQQERQIVTRIHLVGDNTLLEKPLTLGRSIAVSFKNKAFIFWMFTLCVMNIGLQLFLGGINELFSSTGLNMTFVMASSFAPVPLTILVYNKVVKRFGFAVAYRYILTVFAIGMIIMYICNINSASMTETQLMMVAILGGIFVSFAIGAFFSVTYTIPSQLAADEYARTGQSVSTMYFAVEGLFEGVGAGIATGVVLVYLKSIDNISWLPLVVCATCLICFLLSLVFPKTIAFIGKESKDELKSAE
jgi:Na+/melibiose symporter-like transporter